MVYYVRPNTTKQSPRHHLSSCPSEPSMTCLAWRGWDSGRCKESCFPGSQYAFWLRLIACAFWTLSLLCPINHGAVPASQDKGRCKATQPHALQGALEGSLNLCDACRCCHLRTSTWPARKPHHRNSHGLTGQLHFQSMPLRTSWSRWLVYPILLDCSEMRCQKCNGVA
jgi:hypothetical protein